MTKTATTVCQFKPWLTALLVIRSSVWFAVELMVTGRVSQTERSTGQKPAPMPQP